MLFNSYSFLIFICVVYTAFIVGGKQRWLVLLVSSYIFYISWKWEYIILIVISTLVDYFVAIGLERTTHIGKRKWLLAASITVNLSILFFFKYFEFFLNSVLQIGATELVNAFEFVLPVGISFYTFQTMSYTIDVYHGKNPAEKHFGRFALFVTYFPQLVAGPIERAGHLISQIRNSLKFDIDNLIPASRIFFWGLFKKLVIADRVAIIVDPVFADQGSFDAPMLAFASLMFTFQIYCDFSGYSDMAIGLSRLFNINLIQNFDAPYYARSITDFWRRWHISLSSWFRDYIYIPLGGSRVVKWRWYYNLFITFLVSGLWHGANWTFILWGAYHGILLILERVLPKWNLGPAKSLFVFFLVVIGWIMFRAESVASAFGFYKALFSIELFQLGTFKEQLLVTGLSKLDLIVAIFSLILLSIKDLKIQVPFIFLRWSFYLLVFFSIIIFGVGDSQSFIYFQF